jgi:hypothetical protein
VRLEYRSNSESINTAHQASCTEIRSAPPVASRKGGLNSYTTGWQKYYISDCLHFCTYNENQLQAHVTNNNSELDRSPTEATRLRFDQEKITLQSPTGRTFSSYWRFSHQRDQDAKTTGHELTRLYSWSNRSRVASVAERPYICSISICFQRTASSYSIYWGFFLGPEYISSGVNKC